MHMIVSLELNQEDAELFEKYASINNMSMSDMIRNIVLKKIENEFDLQCYERAVEEYRKQPITYSHEQAAMLLELGSYL